MITLLGQRDRFCEDCNVCILFICICFPFNHSDHFPVCAVCNYPLSAACCLNRICSALEQKWNIQWGSFETDIGIMFFVAWSSIFHVLPSFYLQHLKLWQCLNFKPNFQCSIMWCFRHQRRCLWFMALYWSVHHVILAKTECFAWGSTLLSDLMPGHFMLPGVVYRANVISRPIHFPFLCVLPAICWFLAWFLCSAQPKLWLWITNCGIIDPWKDIQYRLSSGK